MNGRTSAKNQFATLGVVRDTKKEYQDYASERKRNLHDVAAAALKALKSLPIEHQNALIEGREPADAAA